MSTIEEQIASIEKEIRETPYHKGTEHHIGRLRARISQLKEKQYEVSTKKGGGVGYHVKKQGDATITLVGAPSVGKSTLINKLTNAHSKIAPYAFTTVTVIPGMMYHKDAKIQILDVPGLITGAELGKGRGKEVLSVVRGSNLLIIMCDIENINSLKTITESLEKAGIRINKTKPNVVIEKKLKGGIQIVTNIKQEFDRSTVSEISKEYRINNAEITIKEKLTLNELIDSFSKNRAYIPAIYVINKIDSINPLEIDMIQGFLQSFEGCLRISAENDINIDNLKDEIWNKLNFVRVYLVRSDQKPSFDNPIIMRFGDKLKYVAECIGSEFSEDKEGAIIWGNGSKYPGQEVSLSKEVVEGMQVRFI